MAVLFGGMVLLALSGSDESSQGETFGNVRVKTAQEAQQQQNLNRPYGTGIIADDGTVVPRNAEEAMKMLIDSKAIRIPKHYSMKFVEDREEARKKREIPISFPKDSIKISTSRGLLPLMVGVANTGLLRAKGLMYYRQFPAGLHAVFFQFPSVAIRDMWMKNTYLPLDMLFIDAVGRVVHIVENTTPLSTDKISSVYPCKAVLEIPAGSAKKWNITLGSLVRHSFFSENVAP